MNSKAKIIIGLILVISITGVATAQFESMMTISEQNPSSGGYESGSTVEMELKLNMQNVQSYNGQIEYNQKYLEFKGINSSSHNPYADPSQGIVYLGMEPVTSPVDSPQATLQFEVNKDVEPNGVIDTFVGVNNAKASVNGSSVDVIGQGTEITINTGEEDKEKKEYDPTLELDDGHQVNRSQTVNIESYGINDKGTFKDLTLELLVDENGNNEFEQSEVVSEKIVSVTEEQQTYDLKYNAKLPEGDYDYRTRLVKGSSVVRSSTDSVLTVYETQQSVEFNVGDVAVNNSDSVVVPIEVNGGSIAGYTAKIDYDTSVVKFDYAEGGDFSAPVTNFEPGSVTLSRSESTTYKDPTLAKLRFEPVQKGTTDLDIVESGTTVSSISEPIVNADYNDGSIKVSEPEESDQNETIASADIKISDKDGSEITFTAEGTEAGEGIETYQWDPDNSDSSIGNTIPGNGFGEPTYVHNYNEPGKYTAEVQITTLSGKTDSDTVTFTVSNNSDDKEDKNNQDNSTDEINKITIDTDPNDIRFGDEISVNIGLESQSIINGYKFRLTYDDSYLEYNGINRSSSGINNPNIDNGSIGQTSYLDISKDSNIETETSELVELRFNVKDPNPSLDLSATTDISIEQSDVYGSGINEITSEEKKLTIAQNESSYPDENDQNETEDDFNETEDDINETERPQNDSQEGLDNKDQTNQTNDTDDSLTEEERSIVQDIVAILRGEQEGNVDVENNETSTNETSTNETSTNESSTDSNNGEEQTLYELFSSLLG